MAVVILDPRFPAMVPIEAYPMLAGDVCYTAEVPVRVQWQIADFGGHVVDHAAVLVTTNASDDLVRERQERGEVFIAAPSLTVDGEHEALDVPKADGADSIDGGADAAIADVEDALEGSQTGAYPSGESSAPDFSGVPVSVMEDIARAIALTSRAYRQGEWENQQTHESLLPYLQEETAEYVAAVGEWTQDPSQDNERQLCAELGDLLLQVLFHAEIANRRGVFDIGHVALSYVEKMRRRAPYYFGEDDTMVSVEEQDRLWAEAKVAEAAEKVEATKATDKFGLTDEVVSHRASHDAAQRGSDNSSVSTSDNTTSDGSTTTDAKHRAETDADSDG